MSAERLVVVGSGIVGLAHAWAGARLGKSVVVVERDDRAVGASIRNFGFVTVTGQQAGAVWSRARRSRDLWAGMVGEAGIDVLQRGLLLPYRRPESAAVVEAFLQTPEGALCEALTPKAFRSHSPGLPAPDMLGALYSPHEVRVDSRQAVPAVRGWLESRWGVKFLTRTAVLEAAPPVVRTSRGDINADAVVVCPGDDLATLFPETIEAQGVTRCRLSMLRLADPGYRLPSVVMSDLGLARYLGYAELPQATALRTRLQAEQPAALANGVHLIIAQSADGSLIVGDSHHYDDTPDPFAPQEAEAEILAEFAAATGLAPPPVVERWTGTYASAADSMFAAAPLPNVRMVMVTSGTGASTAFAIAEEVIGELYQTPLGDTGL